MTRTRLSTLWLALLASSGLLLARSTGAQTPPTDPAPPEPTDAPPPPPAPIAPPDGPSPEPPDSAPAPPPSGPPAPPPPPPATSSSPAPPASSAPPAPVTVTTPPSPVAPAAPAPTTPRAPARPSATEQPAPPPPPPPRLRPADEAPRPADPKKDDDDGEGLLGPFRIGPLVGVGVPSIVSFGGQVKLTRFLGLGVNIGVIPRAQLSLYGKATLSYQEYDVYAHLYPFGGSFFLGAGIGYATMKGSLSQSFDVPTSPPQTVTVSADASVRSLILTPQIGYLYTTTPGFSVGIDIGLQVPIAPSQTSLSLTFPEQTPRSAVDSVSADVNDTLHTIGRQIVPTVNLKVGWLL